MGIDAVVFDMDGLMFDSETIWCEAWARAFEKNGLVEQPGLLATFTGSSRERVQGLILAAYDGDRRALRVCDDHFAIAEDVFGEKGAPAKPGLFELLDWLSVTGIPCAVASGSPRSVVEAVLGHAGLGGLFSAVIAGDDGLPSKPAPDVFLAAASRLGAEPARALVLEDSPTGIRAAAAGGLMPVMVPDLVEPTAEIRGLSAHVCGSLLEVRDLLATGVL